MSKLGNIQESYGKPVIIAVANTYSSTVMDSTSLPKNALIISAPTITDKKGNVYDYGTHNMIMTDNLGNPVRLTYTIQQGNGLNTDTYNPDIIKLDIDKKTLGTNEHNELTVNKQNIIDNRTLVVNDSNLIEVNINGLTSAGLDTLGVVKIDNETLKTTTSGQLYVETENLDRANNTQYGIVTSDNKTVSINPNGVISVNTQNLDRATNTKVGVVKIDNSTIMSSNGVIYVATRNLDRTTENTAGVSKADEITLTATQGTISVNTKGLEHASNTNYGLVKYDNSIVIKNGVASVKNYENIFQDIENEKILLAELQSSVNQLKEIIESNSFGVANGIYSLTCNDTTITNLAKPTYLEEPLNMKTQHVYVSMNVITDCDFVISILFENNETPAIELSQINYNDEFSYQGFDGLLKTYPSTDMKQKQVVLLFNCKNFKATAGKYEKTTKITITISSVDNKEINKKLLYSIVRYNSNIFVKDTLDVEDITKDKIILIPVQNDSYWIEDKPHINNRRGYRNIEELEN